MKATLNSRALTHRERRHTLTFRPYSDGRVQVCSHNNRRHTSGWPRMESKSGADAEYSEALANGYEPVAYEEAREAELFTAPSWPLENN